jgi:hypothetical protein
MTPLELRAVLSLFAHGLLAMVGFAVFCFAAGTLAKLVTGSAW